jgi:hypothetical protein
MYFKEDEQISLYEFGQAAGLKLNPNNRWIKKSEIMDWDKIEERFSHLYCDNNGARATLIRTALGALIIKQEEGFSDEATLQHMPIVSFNFWNETVTKWANEGHITVDEANGYINYGDNSDGDRAIMKKFRL